MRWWDSETVRQWDSVAVWQCAIRLSAYRCPLPAGHCHSERSEESRCMSLVILMLIHTSGREDSRLSDDRHQISDNRRQTYCIPEHKRVQAPSAPGFKASPGLGPWSPPVPPTERAGSEGSYKAHSMEAGCAPPRHFYNAPAGRHYHPLNPPAESGQNPMNLLNPHASGVSMNLSRPQGAGPLCGPSYKSS